MKRIPLSRAAPLALLGILVALGQVGGGESSAAAHRLAHIDATDLAASTGADGASIRPGQIGDIPGLDLVLAAASAVDPTSDILYQLGFTGGAVDTPILFVIEAKTGALSSSVALDARFSNLQVRRDGALVGLSFNGSGTELRSIDPDTGRSTPLATIEGLDFLAAAANALDRPTDTMYQVGLTRGDLSKPCLFVIDAQSGALRSRTVVDRVLVNLQVMADGTLIGLGNRAAGTELFRMDPSKGESTLVAAIEGLDFLPRAANALDVSSGHLYQLGYTAGEGDRQRLFVIDVARGKVLSDQVTAGKPPVNLAVTRDGGLVGMRGAGKTTAGQCDGSTELATDSRTPALAFGLSQNQPNPFNPSTEIRYSLDREAQVNLWVYDATGRLVRMLVSERQQPGSYVVSWDGKDLNGRSVASGVYFSQLEADQRVESRKMTLLK